MAAGTERSGAPATAGEYWRIAAKTAELIADLEGTDLAPHWQQSLAFLVRDAQRAAGAEAVHEVAADGQHAHINNDGQPVTTAEDRERCTYRPPIPANITPLAPVDHYELMRHTGRPECPIAEHTDALRRLGQAILERDQARALARQHTEHIRLLEAANTSLLRRVRYVESRLHHPAGKNRDQQEAA